MELSVSKGPGGTQTITITRREGEKYITETITTASTCTMQSVYSTGSLRRSQKDNEIKHTYTQQVSVLEEWLDKLETNMELVTAESPDPKDQLTLEEQLVLVKVCIDYIN